MYYSCVRLSLLTTDLVNKAPTARQTQRHHLLSTTQHAQLAWTLDTA